MGVLQPESTLIGADAVDRSFVEFSRLAGTGSYTENLMEEEPLFKTNIGKVVMNITSLFEPNESLVGDFNGTLLYTSQHPNLAPSVFKRKSLH